MKGILENDISLCPRFCDALSDLISVLFVKFSLFYSLFNHIFIIIIYLIFVIVFFFLILKILIVLYVYIYVHEDLNLTQNRDPCLSMSVVCRVCAGFDLETVLSESLHSVSLCSLHSFV